MHKLSAVCFALFIVACGGDVGTPSLVPPVITGIAPARWSRSMPTTMTVSGTGLDAVPAGGPWSFPGCKVGSYGAFPVSATSYRLVLTPDPAAAVGDICSLRLDMTGQVLVNAFETWL